jgi:uncharacterized protein (TIGR00304 family)
MVMVSCLNRMRAVSILMIAASAILLALAAIRGELEIALVVIIPVIMGSGPLSLVGGLLLFFGLLVLLLSYLGVPCRRDEDFEPRVDQLEGVSSSKVGGVVLVGPIPIIFGSDWRMASLAIILAMVLIIIAILLLF